MRNLLLITRPIQRPSPFPSASYSYSNITSSDNAGNVTASANTCISNITRILCTLCNVKRKEGQTLSCSKYYRSSTLRKVGLHKKADSTNPESASTHVKQALPDGPSLEHFIAQNQGTIAFTNGLEIDDNPYLPKNSYSGNGRKGKLQCNTKCLAKLHQFKALTVCLSMFLFAVQLILQYPLLCHLIKIGIFKYHIRVLL